jgi:hypothetical protein
VHRCLRFAAKILQSPGPDAQALKIILVIPPKRDPATDVDDGRISPHVANVREASMHPHGLSQFAPEVIPERAEDFIAQRRFLRAVEYLVGKLEGDRS